MPTSSSITEAFVAVNPGSDTDEVVSYLPLAHIYENLISLFQSIWTEATVNFVENIDTLRPKSAGGFPHHLCQRAPDLGEICLLDRHPHVRFHPGQKDPLWPSR